MSIKTKSSLKSQRVSCSQSNWDGHLAASGVLDGPELLHEGLDVGIWEGDFKAILSGISTSSNDCCLLLEFHILSGFHEVQG